jgi:hypothetical protein
MCVAPVVVAAVRAGTLMLRTPTGQVVVQAAAASATSAGSWVAGVLGRQFAQVNVGQNSFPVGPATQIPSYPQRQYAVADSAGNYSTTPIGACSPTVAASPGTYCGGNEVTQFGLISSGCPNGSCFCQYSYGPCTQYGESFGLPLQSRTVASGPGLVDMQVSYAVAPGGGYYSNSSVDPEWLQGNTPVIDAETGAPIIEAGTDPYGNPVAVEIERHPDGSVDVNQSVQLPSVTVPGQSDVTTRNAHFDPGGTVTGTSQFTTPNTSVSTTNGTVQGPTTGTTTPGQIGTSPGGTPVVTTSTGTTGSTTPAITFPNDYAREPTLQTVKTALTSTAATPPTDPAVATRSDFEDAYFGSAFASLIAWRLPPHTAACPTSSFELWGRTFTLDAHCTVAETMRSALSSALVVGWTIVALLIVLGA